MAWSRRLPQTLYLNDGRTIATLAEARDVILALSRLDQTNPHWERAAELLMEAAYRGRLDPIVDVGAQLSRALRADGLI
jgi:DNA-binding SARP family transcriptional activator